MANFKTPGVYVKEISTLPASVAPVATAIPVFIGYTQQRIKNGITLPANKPERITSLLEYIEIFGGAFDENVTVNLTGSDLTAANTTIAVASEGLSPYTLYYNMVSYFGNGGGPCYIVSVGTYTEFSSFPTNPNDLIISTALQAGITAIEKEDEVTLLVVPEAVILSPSLHKTINDVMLTQCNKLQDRFAVMDVKVLGGTALVDANGFRDSVGIEYLKYGASYYPSLITTQQLEFVESTVEISDTRIGAIYNSLSLNIINNGGGVGVPASGTVTIGDIGTLTGATVTVSGDPLIEGTNWDADTSDEVTAGSLAGAISLVAGISATNVGNLITIVADVVGAAGNTIELTTSHPANASVSAPTLIGGVDAVLADKTLYNNIISEINKTFKISLYPSATMAGIFARVDRDRGVWKAPANVGVNGVTKPTVLVTHAEQADLNVDATSGKSINVIRPFTGKGNLVWGARTLAGNDNEWRYVPVRRFFNFMEESIKKATEPSVFEPNTANTWSKLKGMIENFLTQLWSAGALAGATAEAAFFVKVGLGQTMTALDILEGRLNIEVGVAAVRPAEFIILKFSHKLQES